MAAMPAIPGTLNEKQKRFALEYLKDLNMTQAAIRAGYSKHTAKQQGTRLFSNAAIKGFIEETLAAQAREHELSEDWVVSRVRKVVERCMQDVKPVTDRKGEPVLIDNGQGDLVPAYTFDAGNSLKGLELLGKYRELGLWSDKVEHTGPGGGPMQQINVNMDQETAARIYADMVQK